MQNKGANFTHYSNEKIIDYTANKINNGKAIGWFQGRMEFGPRALGARSILADPRSKTMQKNLNSVSYTHLTLPTNREV